MEHAGVIEGFYGPPWSWEARLEVAADVAAAGGDLYVYAPKDDPLHRARWREAYPAEEALALERFATTAPLRCAFALSPGLDIDPASAGDRRLLAAKLRWSTTLGFELVVLALDDIPIVPGSGLVHGQLWREVTEALDPVPVLLVPSDYTSIVATPYLDGLVAGLAGEACSVGWTGPLVVNDAITVADARGRAAACGGRLPMLWDNTPVNDAVMADRLHLGPYEGRPAALREELQGVLLNPMVQARASLPTLLSGMAWASGDDPAEAWSTVVDARGWRSLAEGLDARRGRELLAAGDLDGLDAWLADLDPSAPGLGPEVAPWQEQLRVEADLARRILGAARSGDAMDSFAALAEWRAVQGRARHSVLGARRSLRPAASVAPDGTFTGGPGILRDDNLLDQLVHELFG